MEEVRKVFDVQIWFGFAVVKQKISSLRMWLGGVRSIRFSARLSPFWRRILSLDEGASAKPQHFREQTAWKKRKRTRSRILNLIAQMDFLAIRFRTFSLLSILGAFILQLRLACAGFYCAAPFPRPSLAPPQPAVRLAAEK